MSPDAWAQEPGSQCPQCSGQYPHAQNSAHSDQDNALSIQDSSLSAQDSACSAQNSAHSAQDSIQDSGHSDQDSAHSVLAVPLPSPHSLASQGQPAPALALLHSLSFPLALIAQLFPLLLWPFLPAPFLTDCSPAVLWSLTPGTFQPQLLLLRGRCCTVNEINKNVQLQIFQIFPFAVC